MKHYYKNNSDMMVSRKVEEALMIFPERLKTELENSIKKPIL